MADQTFLLRTNHRHQKTCMTSFSTFLNKRYSSLDLLRGFGIWMIILYHVYKNIFTPNPYHSFIFQSLYFTTGYFVFSVGLVLALHYFPKIATESSKNNIRFRLIIRSIKLITLVIVANVIFLFLSRDASVRSLLNQIHKMITLLYTDRWDVSYQVLVPISATLVIGSFFIDLLWRFPKNFISSILVSLIIASILFPNGFPYLWKFTIYGVIGILSGYIYIKFASENSLFHSISVCAVLFAAFLTISFYAVYGDKDYYIINNLPLGILSSASYTLSLFIFLERVVSFGNSKEHSCHITNYVIHIGKNSLFYYFTQGLFCIIFSKFFYTNSDFIAIITSLIVLIFCSLLYLLIKFLRRIRSLDLTYNFIFH